MGIVVLSQFQALGSMILGDVIPFLLVLTVVVFIHELGHFLIARWCGVRVLAFSIGFGPYNLNDWAKKLLKEDYTLESRGWTRILIGVQNLVSLYLFALTILLLFGDPFNF